MSNFVKKGRFAKRSQMLGIACLYWLTATFFNLKAWGVKNVDEWALIHF